MTGLSLFEGRERLRKLVEDYRSINRSSWSEKLERSFDELATDIEKRIREYPEAFEDVTIHLAKNKATGEERIGKIVIKDGCEYKRTEYRGNPAQYLISPDTIEDFLQKNEEASDRTLDVLSLFLGYKCFKGLLQEEAGRLRPKRASENPKTKNDKSYLPKDLTRIHSVDPAQVIGRNRELNDLHQLLTRYKHCQVQGTGGIGKTTLLGNYLASNYAQALSHVCWIQVSSNWTESLISNQLLISNLGIEFGDNWTTETKYDCVIGHLSRIKKKSLLVIDNAVSEINSFLTALPRAEWQVVILSREKIRDLPCLELGALELPDSLRLFNYYYKGLLLDKDLIRLINLVDRLPLAIELFAKTLRSHPMLGRVSAIIERFETRTANYGDWQVGVSTSHSPERDRAFNHILSIISLGNYSQDPSIQQLLTYLSLFPSSCLSKSFVFEVLMGAIEEPDLLNDNLARLVNFGLIKFMSDGRLYMHKLVVEVIFYLTCPNYESCQRLVESTLFYLQNGIFSISSVEMSVQMAENLKRFLAIPPELLAILLFEIGEQYTNENYGVIDKSKTFEYLDQSIELIRAGANVPNDFRNKIEAIYTISLYERRRGFEFIVQLEKTPEVLDVFQGILTAKVCSCLMRAIAETMNSEAIENLISFLFPDTSLPPKALLDGLQEFSVEEAEYLGYLTGQIGDILCNMLGRDVGIEWMQISLSIFKGVKGTSAKLRVKPNAAAARYFFQRNEAHEAERYVRDNFDIVEPLCRKLDIRLSGLHFELGEIFEKLGREEEAIEKFKIACEIDSMNGWHSLSYTHPYQALFRVSYHLGCVEEIVDFLTRLVRNFGSFTNSKNLKRLYKTLAYGYSVLGKVGMAEACLQEVFNPIVFTPVLSPAQTAEGKITRLKEFLHETIDNSSDLENLFNREVESINSYRVDHERLESLISDFASLCELSEWNEALKVGEKLSQYPPRKAKKDVAGRILFYRGYANFKAKNFQLASDYLHEAQIELENYYPMNESILEMTSRMIIEIIKISDYSGRSNDIEP